MKRPHAVVWALLGLVAGAGGWAAGALIGSNMGRTVFAATLVAVALGLLARRPRLALLAGLATAAVAAGAFVVGGATITPLLAWPAAGLAIGLSSFALLPRGRARVMAAIATPLLGSLGFLLGMVATGFAGMAVNNPVLAGQFLWGGAAGFGLLTIATVRVLGARLDRVPAPVGEPS
jgi:hypothetical protein